MSEPVTVLSLGAGVQSSCLALMAADGEIEKPDFAVFADTGDEPSEVYDWLDKLVRLLPFKVIIKKTTRLSDELFKWGQSQIPAFMLDEKGNATIGKRQCTKHWKVVPIQRAIRQETGTAGKMLPEHAVHLWKGISTDEAHRAKDDREPWIKSVFPLLDMSKNRQECKQWLRNHGFPDVPKSACVYCPYRSNSQWAASKAKGGDEWDLVVSVDRRLNERGEFLHQSCKPIDQVNFTDADKNQLSLFGNECEGMCGL